MFEGCYTACRNACPEDNRECISFAVIFRIIKDITDLFKTTMEGGIKIVRIIWSRSNAEPVHMLYNR